MVVSNRPVNLRKPPIVALLLAMFGTPRPLPAADFSAQVVDGLNRPVPGVRFVVFCASSGGRTGTLRLASDQDGRGHGTYDAASCTPLSATVGKEGYGSYSSGIRSRYVLRREFDPQEVLRAVTGDGDRQQNHFRELLAGSFSVKEGQFRDTVFRHESRLRPLLLALVREPEVTESARELLSVIGVADDLDFILRLPPPPASPGFPERWRYAAATALVNPETGEGWSSLRRCALNEFGDRWVDAGAIQTLQLTASERSRRLLEEAPQKNKFQASRIARALEHIASSPLPLSDTNLEALAKRVAFVIGPKTWQANGSPRFNEARDKALVDLEFQTSMDRLVYTATFHKKGGDWNLRGVRETYQAFAPAPVVRKQ
jgi:hypothetical protein